MYILGIDPGLEGGLCVMSHKGIEQVLKMPKCTRPNRKGNYIDLNKIYNFISQYTYNGIFIERQFILRSQGMSSGGKTMYQVGCLYGMCFPLTDNLNEINAKDWQKSVFPKVDETKINQYNYDETKLKSIGYVEQVFDISYLFHSSRQKKPSDGLADAICIASYGLEMTTPKTTK